jgi:S1-C subfamily serine protease
VCSSDLHQITANNLRCELVGYVGDVAILYNQNFKTPFPIPLGDSDKLRLGDRLLNIGYSFACEVNVKDGVVSNLSLSEESYNEPEVAVCFLHSIPTNRGDSGSPVLAWQDGRMRVVGITNAKLQDHGLAFAIKINHIKEVFENLK